MNFNLNEVMKEYFKLIFKSDFYNYQKLNIFLPGE